MGRFISSSSKKQSRRRLCELCSTHKCRSSTSSICLYCFEKNKKFQIGDFVHVHIAPEDIPGEEPGDYVGVLAHYVPKCRGWAVRVDGKRKHVFVSEDALRHVQNTDALRELDNSVSVKVPYSPKPCHVAIHHTIPEYAHSLQRGNIIAEFPHTKQYLTRLVDFKGKLWKDGYEMVYADRLFPEKFARVKRVQMGKDVLVKDPACLGLWYAKVTSVDVDGKTLWADFRNENAGKEEAVKGEWLYEVE